MKPSKQVKICTIKIDHANILMYFKLFLISMCTLYLSKHNIRNEALVFWGQGDADNSLIFYLMAFECFMECWNQDIYVILCSIVYNLSLAIRPTKDTSTISPYDNKMSRSITNPPKLKKMTIMERHSLHMAPIFICQYWLFHVHKCNDKEQSCF